MSNEQGHVHGPRSASCCMARGCAEKQAGGADEGTRTWRVSWLPIVHGEEKESKLAMLVGVLSSHHVRHEERTVGAHAWLKEKPCKGWTNLRTKGTMALGPCGNEETQ